MNLRPVVSLLLLATLLAASSCEKTNDLPRMQDEALAAAKQYQARFDELARRAEVVSKRGNTIRADALNSAEAQRVYRQALTVIAEIRAVLDGIPAGVKAAASDEPDALPKLLDSMRERCDHALTEANGELAAVESWIGFVELQQGSRSDPPPAPAAPAAPAPPGPSTDDPGRDPAGSSPPIR